MLKISKIIHKQFYELYQDSNICIMNLDALIEKLIGVVLLLRNILLNTWPGFDDC